MATGSDDGAANRLGGEDEQLAERPDYPLSGLHAKLFVSEFHHSARMWTGSANATNAAFSGNVEFLVELQGARSACGIDAVLEGRTGGAKLRDLLQTYEPPDAPPPETDQQRLERRLDEVRRDIASLGFEATVVAAEDDDESYSLVVRAITPETFAGLRGVRARLWPITLGIETAKPFEAALAGGIRFAPVSFAGITAFFAIELEAESRGTRSSLRFVVAAALVGAPANRYDRLLTTILRNKGDVLRYLLLLLADERTASMIGSVGGGDTSPGDGWAAVSGLPVLESMIRALARDPERLDHVERLIKSLARERGGASAHPRRLGVRVGADLGGTREAATMKSIGLDLEQRLRGAQGLPARDRRVRLRSALRGRSERDVAIPRRRRGRAWQDARRARSDRQDDRAPREGRPADRRRLRLLELGDRPAEHPAAQRDGQERLRARLPDHAAPARSSSALQEPPQLRLVHAGHLARPQVDRGDRPRARASPPPARRRHGELRPCAPSAHDASSRARSRPTPTFAGTSRMSPRLPG